MVDEMEEVDEVTESALDARDLLKSLAERLSVFVTDLQVGIAAIERQERNRGGER